MEDRAVVQEGAEGVGARYALVVAVYNRPGEMGELLESLVAQSVHPFDLIVVEDGSTERCESLFQGRDFPFAVHYLFRENGGPGAARNTGVYSEQCRAEYVLFVDSDCLLPSDYFARLEAWHGEHVDAALWGGPDAAHPDFSALQKAISFAMTWRGSTGGIRGGRGGEGFRPRTFNMGVSREWFLRVGGFAAMRYGEDVDLSERIIAAGGKSYLAEDLIVYHKRRERLGQFFRQVYHSGRARVDLMRRGGGFRLVHALPALAIVLAVVLPFCGSSIFWFTVNVAFYYGLLVFMISLGRYGSFRVGLLAVPAVACMIFGYGFGYLSGVFGLVFRRGSD